MVFQEWVMTHKKDWLKVRQALRSEAETVFSDLFPAQVAARPEAALMHELLVHKFELEAQVEELRRIHAELETTRDHYAEYYEYAPMGFLTLDRDGRICESNLTGAALLGVERATLTSRHFGHFVSNRDQDRWHRLFRSMLEDPSLEQHACMLGMVRSNGTHFAGYLDCRCLLPQDALMTIRVALFDTTVIQQFEEG